MEVMECFLVHGIRRILQAKKIAEDLRMIRTEWMDEPHRLEASLDRGARIKKREVAIDGEYPLGLRRAAGGHKLSDVFGWKFLLRLAVYEAEHVAVSVI